MERLEEDQLRDAAHDAFMAFWRGKRAELWVAYCEAQERYEAYLIGRSQSLPKHRCYWESSNQPMGLDGPIST